jgi:hypothetical protein
MTPNRIQNVRPRRQTKFSAGLARRLPAQFRTGQTQRGSISSTTITITLGISVLLTVTFLSFFYLGQVQNTALQGSDIRDLEERIIDLRERQRELELEGAELRSIRTIEQHIPELNLETTDRVSYLTRPGEQVAARPTEQ